MTARMPSGAFPGHRSPGSTWWCRSERSTRGEPVDTLEDVANREGSPVEGYQLPLVWAA